MARQTVRLALKFVFACLFGFTTYCVSLIGGDPVVRASSSLPDLTITEIVANSSGDSPSVEDAYEYVELKNNTAASIDLSGYRFKFWYTPTQFVTWDMTASQSIPAGGVRVVWIKNTYGQGKTLANFNAHYGTSFTSSTLYTLDLGNNGGLGNGGIKKLILQKDTGADVCVASYNDRVLGSTTTNDDTLVEDSSIVYEFPQYLVDGNLTMRKVAANQKPTTGTIPAPPSIWITELLPNPSISSTDLNDAYEYVELYNNTASAVNLSGYRFRYYWDPANPSNYTDWDLTVSKTIPAYGYMVVWLKGTQANGKTLADFAAHYHLPSTYLTSSRVYEQAVSTGQSMGNDGKRTVELRTDGGTAIVSATYNDGTANDSTSRIDVDPTDTSVAYGYPVDGTITMRKLVSGQYPTPGMAYNWFTGQMHAHTKYSEKDGTQTATNTPQYAFQAAKDQGDDFMGVTDHSEQLDGGDPNVANGEWADTRLQADLASVPYQFSGFAGYELTYNTTTSIWGHIGGFNTGGWFADRWDTVNGRQYNLHDYWDDLATRPAALFQFNHPGAYWGDFEDFAPYTQSADDQSALFEFNNDTISNGERFDRYVRALDRGWHVAPTWNGDIHQGNWMQDNNRLVVLAETNTKEGILDAIRARRAYVTYGDRDIKVAFEINGQPMGSRLTNPSTLNVSVMAANPTNDPISKITLYGPGGQVLGSQSFSSRLAHYTASLPQQYAYYFAKVEQTDGDWAITAPIWITDSPGIELTMSTQSTTTAGVPVQIKANVRNTTASALSNVLVEFYKDDYNTPSDNYSSANKVGEVTLASISAGATSTASSTWAPAGGAGTYRILARVTAQVGGVAKSVTGGIHLPELYITEIVSNSPGHLGTADVDGDYFDEDYDFVEVYNNSKNTVNLKDYKLGDTYVTAYDITVDSFIPAKSAKVIWVKKANSTKTLADFNAAYGTSLTSSQLLELKSTDANSGLRFKGTGWIDLVRDSDNTRIQRAKYNNGVDIRETYGPAGTYGADSSVDGLAIRYAYPVDGSLYARKLQSNVTPTPGAVSSDQLAP
ncbi:lamin tail domain-containing protein [Paenibacillus sp. GYB003]|uniref:lamin tail domain-containing protein n=1 Tax=Paenibacillus sp. GYB003 TaxID=2994392 RepID=UPI002F964DD3